MDDEHSLIFHPITAAAIGDYVRQPAHAVLISGAPGSGKASAARHIVRQVLASPKGQSTHLDNHPYLRTIAPIDAKAIPIETVRALQHFLSLKIPGTDQQTIRRAIIIEDAHLLTIEAQNALLKTLEEPPADTIIILTATSPDRLLPTIQSRTRVIRLLAAAADQTTTYFTAQGFGRTDVERALLLSAGLPGLTAALLQEDTNHPLVAATVQARGILQSKTYERLLLVDGLSKQKPLCQDILYVLGQMSRMALMKTTNSSTAARWQRILRASYDASRRLSANVQPKLVLTNLMLEL